MEKDLKIQIKIYGNLINKFTFDFSNVDFNSYNIPDFILFGTAFEMNSNIFVVRDKFNKTRVEKFEN